MNLTLRHNEYEIIIAQESPRVPTFETHSTDQESAPAPHSFFGDTRYLPASRQRVTVWHGEAVIGSRILLAGSGATGVHAHSAFVHGDRCFIAIGSFAVVLELPTLRLLWQVEVDPAACFGVHHAPGHASVISHGELQIVRLSYDGQELWSAGGRDIFTGPFELHAHHAEVTDFEGTVYRIELATGQAQILPV